MGKAVFLDRDGTIIEDTGYIHQREQVRFLAGASQAIRLLNEKGFKVIIITNQAGVARGYFTEDSVKEVNRYVRESLAEDRATVDMVYYCPHHVDGVVEEYKKECNCRKPSPGMIEAAVRDFGIDLKGSFVIGDKASDVEAGRRAGCRTILIAGEHPSEKEQASMPDHVAASLYEAVMWLLGTDGRGQTA